jgi:pimeloyl-ACP methyl ester carboxylesterase
MLPQPLSAIQEAEMHGVLAHTAQGGELDYFAYVPRTVSPYSGLLVTVHGIERKALQHAIRFAQLAEEHSLIVLAPLFSKRRLPRYQRTQRGTSGECPLEALEHTIDHFLRWSDIEPARKFLFGYSGGAQFAMRYALRGRVAFEKLVLAAPGWFTMPEPGLPFPYGLGPSIVAGSSLPDLERLISTPTLVVVGTEDTRRDSSLNREPIVDTTQGQTRLERARRWIEAMNGAAEKLGTRSASEMRILRGAGHDFEDNMKSHGLGKIACDWLGA